ncbi:MAG: response regulator [Acidimicrobiales bacterium]
MVRLRSKPCAPAGPPGPRGAQASVGSKTRSAAEARYPLPFTPVSERVEEDVVRVLIADDQVLFRRGLEAVLGTEDGIEVVGEADDGVEAVARAEELAPDVVLMDVRMPRLGGIEAARRIRDALPSTRILMLTVSDEEDDLYEAVKAGANGYLLKEVSVEEVAGAVRSVLRGESLISPSMASKLLNEFNLLARQADRREELPGPVLTARELEVLKLVATGMSNKEVADRLVISENTVKNHVRNILEKLHLHSRMEAVMYAVRKRLLDPHHPDL